jgi:hypothetical protein
MQRVNVIPTLIKNYTKCEYDYYTCKKTTTYHVNTITTLVKKHARFSLIWFVNGLALTNTRVCRGSRLVFLLRGWKDNNSNNNGQEVAGQTLQSLQVCRP